MITLLERIFIKQGKDERRAYGILCGSLGIALNLLLFAGKYLAGFLSGSIAVMADAFNNLSDAGSSVITLLGFQFAGQAADKEHPFGHGRIEYLSGLAVSIAIIVMGVELGRSSIEKIIHPEAVDTGILSVAILLVSVAVKLYMSFYNRRIGAKIDSSAMKATAMDSLSDALATSMVLISMLIMKFTGVNVDGWCGVLVAAFILKAGYEAAKETLNPLLGQAPEPEFIDEIQKIVLSRPEIIGIHDLVVHDYGPGHRMVSLHGEVDGSQDIFELHDAIDGVEMELQERLGCEAVIHMDPVNLTDPEMKEKKAQIEKMVKAIDERLTIHDFRLVHGGGVTKLLFDVVMPFSMKMGEEELKKQVQDKVCETMPCCCAIIQIDHSYV
ncbi:MAG: cation transporter [Clostridium sp.]|nr:cation transporter [Clostridium sp.]